jgi:hypothetical protein
VGGVRHPQHTQTNIRKWQMGFNSAFKGLITLEDSRFLTKHHITQFCWPTYRKLLQKILKLILGTAA